MAADIVVVDTNVVSYLFKKDTRGELYQSVLDGKLLMIAAQNPDDFKNVPNLIIITEKKVA
ncbi:MAG: hypothetical protein QOJ02_4065 [Acidobacteriota bacterium]|jgi:hypothetical protein|nr:hypothetical protein [Acidobacteriota bacterium]